MAASLGWFDGHDPKELLDQELVAAVRPGPDGETLVEIQGQGEQRGLLDPATHRELLDALAEHSSAAATLVGAWRDWRSSRRTRTFERMQSPPSRRAAPGNTTTRC